MKQKIKNTFWFRHFLICNKFAINMCWLHGWSITNSAKCILDEQNGVYANSQMTKYFLQTDRILSELHQSDEGIVFDALQEDDGISIKDLANLTDSELNDYYNEYVVGKIDFSNLI